MGEANALRSLGGVSYQQGRHDEANDRYNQALAIYQRIGYSKGETLAVKAIHRLSSPT